MTIFETLPQKINQIETPKDIEQIERLNRVTAALAAQAFASSFYLAEQYNLEPTEVDDGDTIVRSYDWV